MAKTDLTAALASTTPERQGFWVEGRMAMAASPRQTRTGSNHRPSNPLQPRPSLRNQHSMIILEVRVGEMPEMRHLEQQPGTQAVVGAGTRDSGF